MRASEACNFARDHELHTTRSRAPSAAWCGILHDDHDQIVNPEKTNRSSDGETDMWRNFPQASCLLKRKAVYLRKRSKATLLGLMMAGAQGGLKTIH